MCYWGLQVLVYFLNGKNDMYLMKHYVLQYEINGRFLK